MTRLQAGRFFFSGTVVSQWAARQLPPFGDICPYPGTRTMPADRPNRPTVATEQQEISFRLLVEQVRDYAIFLLDPAGYVVTWNTGAAWLKGYRADEIIGQHFSRFYPPEDVAAGKTDRELAIAISEGRVEDEGWRIRKDGSRFWANVVITAIRNETGTLLGFAKVTRDLTERQRAADDLRRTNEDLERRVVERTADLSAANAELRALDQQRSEFLAMLGHELRNPLAPVRNALQILRAPNADAVTVDWAKGMIDRQVRQLAGLIDQLLDMSRLTRGLIHIIRRRIDVNQVARTAAEDRRGVFAEAGVGFTIVGPADPIWVKGDAIRLTQVVSNLLDNAVKFTDREGGVELNVSSRDGEANITVRDTGIGIPAEVLPRVFDIFAQADGTLDRTRGGLGLGLALVKGLVDLHGGTVSAASEGPGKGAAFTVRLPLAPETAKGVHS
jgi:PAS domain S-box-containing protein